MEIREFLNVAALAVLSASAVSIAVTLYRFAKRFDEYASVEYCDCPCHDEDRWSTSDLWD